MSTKKLLSIIIASLSFSNLQAFAMENIGEFSLTAEEQVLKDLIGVEVGATELSRIDFISTGGKKYYYVIINHTQPQNFGNIVTSGYYMIGSYDLALISKVLYDLNSKSPMPPYGQKYQSLKLKNFAGIFANSILNSLKSNDVLKDFSIDLSTLQSILYKKLPNQPSRFYDTNTNLQDIIFKYKGIEFNRMPDEKKSFSNLPLKQQFGYLFGTDKKSESGKPINSINLNKDYKVPKVPKVGILGNVASGNGNSIGVIEVGECSYNFSFVCQDMGNNEIKSFLVVSKCPTSIKTFTNKYCQVLHDEENYNAMNPLIKDYCIEALSEILCGEVNPKYKEMVRAKIKTLPQGWWRLSHLLCNPKSTLMSEIVKQEDNVVVVDASVLVDMNEKLENCSYGTELKDQKSEVEEGYDPEDDYINEVYKKDDK